MATFLSLFCVMLLQTAHAGEWDHPTKVTFNQPVEVPGVVLNAGTYWFVLAEDVSNRDVVRIFSNDWSELYATELTIPAYRDTKNTDTVLIFAERPRAGHEALIRWFYPGRETGCEFLYSRQVEQRLRSDVQQVVDASPGS
jgi:hypothetical protein